MLLNRPKYDNKKHYEIVNDKDGILCVAPQTRVLTPDLKWIKIGKCKIGDKLLAFDEFNTAPRFKRNVPSGYRHWKIATVLNTKKIKLPCYKLTFNDGTKIICSENHKWLGGKNRGLRWLTTKNWNTTISRKNQKAWVLKILPVVEKENTYESGWLGGFADGEGHYHGSAAGGGGSWAVSLHQAEGDIIEYAYGLLQKSGYSIRIEKRQREERYKKMVSLHINGGMRETFRFLMSCRPERLINNLIKGIEKKSIYTRQKQYVYVEKMEYVGIKEVVALETDTHTYIAEGLASHNCNVWRALQQNPDEVAKWCDYPINHADLAGRKGRLIEKEGYLLENLIKDDMWHDAKLAGYWIWASSCWIGSGLTRKGAIPHLTGNMGVHQTGKRPHLTGNMGVHQIGKRPHLTGNKGVHQIGKIPHLTDNRGVQEPYNTNIYKWFRELSERLRYVKVVCGDWQRVCGGNWQDSNGLVGMFLDPPYGVEDRDTSVYHCDSTDIATDVLAWVKERGQKETYRIVLAGYEEYQELVDDYGWTKHTWKTGGGYGNMGKGQGKKNRHRETLYISPHCVKNSLF